MSDEPTPETTDSTSEKRTMSEEIEVAGNQVVERVQELVKEGNVRRLIIRNPDDKVLLEMPLTVGASGGGGSAMHAMVRLGRLPV